MQIFYHGSPLRLWADWHFFHCHKTVSTPVRRAGTRKSFPLLPLRAGVQRTPLAAIDKEGCLVELSDLLDIDAKERQSRPPTTTARPHRAVVVIAHCPRYFFIAERIIVHAAAALSSPEKGSLSGTTGALPNARKKVRPATPAAPHNNPNSRGPGIDATSP